MRVKDSGTHGTIAERVEVTTLPTDSNAVATRSMRFGGAGLGTYREQRRPKQGGEELNGGGALESKRVCKKLKGAYMRRVGLKAQCEVQIKYAQIEVRFITTHN